MAKVLGAISAVFLFGLGLLFLIASSQANTIPRIIIGVIAIAMAVSITWLLLLKKEELVKKVELIQKIELSGDIKVEELKCKNCGASLDKNSISLKEGATFIKCSYCGREYNP